MTRQYIQNLLQREFSVQNRSSVCLPYARYLASPFANTAKIWLTSTLSGGTNLSSSVSVSSTKHQLLSSGKSSLPSIPSSSGW